MTDLLTKDIAELRAILKSLGGDTRGKLKPETLIERINVLRAMVLAADTHVPLESPPIESKPASDPHSIIAAIMPGLPKKAAAVIGGCSEQEVLESVKVNIEKGMTAIFHENTWIFKKGARQDSGTMSQPLYNIKKCADAVCQHAVPAHKLKLGEMNF